MKNWMNACYAGRVAMVVIAAFGQLTCGQAILNAPVGSTLVLTVNPPAIPANGGVAIVSATVFEPAGTPVPDGTVVQFFTTLGRIDEQGKTNDGVARVKLVSDARSGTATVTALAGDQREEQDVTIGNTNIAHIVLRANPPRITNSNSTHVFAAVFDADGNPFPNVPVYFSIKSSSPAMATEFFETSGPVFTNNNGEAENVLRTRRDTQGTVTVTATVPGAASATISPPDGLVIPIQ
jgi:hypothetical protein